MLFPILTIVGGLIAASSLIIAKKPNAAQLFTRIAPYQGFLGLGLLSLSILWLLDVMPQIGSLLTSTYGLLALAAIALNGVIGFLLGFGLLNRFVLSKSAAAAAKGQRLQSRLVPIQAPLGLAAAAVGMFSLIL